MKKIAILISGRGSNMEAIINNCQQGILQNTAKVALVISNNPTAKGLIIAQKAKIPTIIIPSKGKSKKELSQSLVLALANYDLDLIVLAGFMRILSSNLIKKYPQKIINIHPADTKLHQGLAGYKWAWENKLKATKITVHYVNNELDKGQILAQKAVSLIGINSLNQIEKKGLEQEHQLYSQVIFKLFS